MIGGDQAADHGLAQTGAGVDDRFVAGARDGIRGEHHPGGSAAPFAAR